MDSELKDLVFGTVALLSFIALVASGPRIGSFILDHRYSKDGIDFVMFGGAFRLCRIGRDKIKAVEIVNWYELLWRLSCISIGSCHRKKVLVVKISYGISLAFTPVDPVAAVDALGMGSISRHSPL